MIKVLSIGNSFSQDAHRWLKDICDAGGIEVKLVNLYVGGCSLQQHCSFFENEEQVYDYELAAKNIKKISLNQALTEDKWDIITVQQVSSDSGRPQSYFPYLEKLVNIVRRYQPDAKLYFHKTWSYETDSDHNAFEGYNFDQGEMYRRLSDCSEMAAKLIGAEIIPSGDLIQHLRENEAVFDYKNGGLSLNRDGYHLTADYGRYAAACVWYKVLFGGDVKENTFAPENTDSEIIQIIKKAVISL